MKKTITLSQIESLEKERLELYEKETMCYKCNGKGSEAVSTRNSDGSYSISIIDRIKCYKCNGSGKCKHKDNYLENYYTEKNLFELIKKRFTKNN